MGKPSKFPPGPISQQCLEGREQFRRAFKAWSRQWTQPQLLKLTQAGLKDRVIHSSQISGFATGTLYDPAPKVLLALGRFNEMLAAGELPETLAPIWNGRAAMLSPTGNPMGPAEMFLAFTGELDLQMDQAREIPMELESLVSKMLGKHVRTELAKRGIDFVVEDHQRLLNAAGSFKGLLSGSDVRGEVLLADLPTIAAEIDSTPEELWELISNCIAANTPKE